MGTNAAYVAGLIDGEWCVHLCTSKNTYRGRVTVGMTAPALATLERLQMPWGGSLVQGRKATTAWEEAWVWTVTGAEAATLLQAAMPYLRIKAGQAYWVLEVERIRASLPRRPNGSGAWTPEARAECAAIKGRLHELNCKGHRSAMGAVA